MKPKTIINELKINDLIILTSVKDLTIKKIGRHF